MKNLLFTLPKHIFTEHLYVTYHHHIYRYKQYLTDIKILRVLITITKTAIMLVINNHNDDINNNIIIITIKKRKEKKKKQSSEEFRTYSHTKNFTRV